MNMASDDEDEDELESLEGDTHQMTNPMRLSSASKEPTREETSDRQSE